MEGRQKKKKHPQPGVKAWRLCWAGAAGFGILTKIPRGKLTVTQLNQSE